MDSVNNRIPLWLKYGIKELKFHSKYKMNYDDIRSYYIENIINSNKVIPTIDMMNEDGMWYKRRDLNTSGFDGFDLSYFMVSYLICNNYDVENLIFNGEELKKVESSLIQNTINYYNNYFKTSFIKDNFSDIDTPFELMDFMNKKMIYGFVDEEGEKHIYNLKGISPDYKTKSLDSILKSGVGNCIDQAKIQQAFFNNKGIENKIYCFLYQDMYSDKIKVHSITLYKENDKWYHFEHAFYNYRGIHEFDNIDELIYSFKEKCLSNAKVISVKEINEIPSNITLLEFINYSKKSNINSRRI